MILELREAQTLPVDFEGILPEKLEHCKAIEVAKRTVLHGNRRVELGELFNVRPLGHDIVFGDLIFEGDLSHARNLGRGMSDGRITVIGHSGWHVGARMSGGVLQCNAAGHWLGAEMTGGHILVEGDAGDQVGAAYRGSRAGMSGGRIVIHGSAGDELGLLMRRGTIEVQGTVGRFAGVSMIAGTIVSGTSFGENAGAGMKRGTILSAGAVLTGPGFVTACEYSPPFLPLLMDELIIDRSVFQDVQVRCYRGDLITSGRGEIWQVV